jgi:creatinine amidohydrolase
MTGVLSGFWHDMTSEDFAEVDPESAIALLPVAATEQHGPHLPLYTDSYIAEGIVDRVLELLPDELTVLVLPLLPVGESREHTGFAGTLSLSPETVIRLWREVGESVAQAGLRKLVILNSHGGQPQIVDIVAQELRLERRMLVVKANSFRFAVPPGLFSEEELAHGVHAGALETSLMLHLRPDLVRGERAERFDPLTLTLDRDYPRLGKQGPARFAWAAQDLHPSGASGDAGEADAERGRLVLDHVARELVKLLDDVRRFPLEWLREPL